MEALPHESGVAFRIWAPHADAVYATGSFNQWSSDAHPLTKQDGSYPNIKMLVSTGLQEASMLNECDVRERWAISIGKIQAKK
jgi:1,4-alpha-glucan branching enzyme